LLIADLDQLSGAGVADRTAPFAPEPAGPQVPSIPAGVRHPDLDLDVRVRGRRQSGRDPAKRRQIGENLAIGCGVGPAATDWAAVTVVSASAKSASLAHVAAAAAVAPMPTNAVSNDVKSTLAALCRPLMGAKGRCFCVMPVIYAPHGESFPVLNFILVDRRRSP
jgi:hypothetical protein